jgi:hypothetical protein
VEGSEAYPTSNSRLAANVLSRARRFEIPVLGFFCESPMEIDSDHDDEIHGKAYWDEVSESMLVNLVYTLIRQVISLLPRNVATKKKLTKKIFKELDGTIYSWDAAIDVLKMMLRLAPKTCLIVIDGLDRLGNEWGEHIDDVLGAIGKYVDESSPRQWKLLLTTGGYCEVLDEALDEDEIVEVMPRYRKRGQLDVDEELDGVDDD